MKDNILISVVIPLYNKEHTVIRALTSVLSQSLNPLEIIVVNDGSIDKSVEVVESLSSALIRLIHQPNSGVSSARNTGIQNAKGEWIAFLDADDEWFPEYLSRINEIHQQFPDCNALATEYYFGTSDGSLKKAKIKGIKSSSVITLLSDYFRVSSKSSPPVWTSAVVVRKSELEKIKGFPTGVKLGEDLLTWAKLAIDNKIGYCREPLAIFWHDKIQENQLRLPEIPDVVGNSLNQMLQQCGKNKVPGLKSYISHWHKMRAHLYINAKMNKEAKSEIKLALSFNPLNFKVMLYWFYLHLPTRIKKNIYPLFSEVERKVRV